MADDNLTSFDIAAQALSQGVRSDSGLPPEIGGLELPPENQPTPPSPEAPQVDAGTTDDSDSFTKLDPSLLSPFEQQRYQQMQSDYTRKTQELADQRKAYGELDLDQAREALDFYQALQTDPQYAQQVHQALTQSLQQSGYSLGDAQAAASSAMGQQQQTAGQDMYGFDDEPNFGPDPRDQALSQMQERLDQIEQQNQYTQFAQHMQRSEMAVRQANPTYTDSDIQRVYSISLAHDNDLIKAADEYNDWKSGVLTDYFNQKANVPSAGAPTNAAAYAQEPNVDLLDPAVAHKAAQAHLAQILANGGS